MSDRSVKITFAGMRASGVRGLLVHCSNDLCSHSIAISGFPISSRGLCARSVGGAAPKGDRTSTETFRDPQVWHWHGLPQSPHSFW